MEGTFPQGALVSYSQHLVYFITRHNQGKLKGKYYCTIDLLCDWFGLVCFANKNKIGNSDTADSKPVKQEVNGTVILPPLVFPGPISTMAKIALR